MLQKIASTNLLLLLIVKQYFFLLPSGSLSIFANERHKASTRESGTRFPPQLCGERERRENYARGSPLWVGGRGVLYHSDAFSNLSSGKNILHSCQC